jgi:hypothetical protein
MGADGFVLQKATTVMGQLTNQRLTQIVSEWYDAGEHRQLAVRIVASVLNQCTLRIQTSPTRDSAESDGQWRDAVTVSTATTGANYTLDVSQGATYPLDRFVRWQVVSDGTVSTPPWVASFWIALVAKK